MSSGYLDTFKDIWGLLLNENAKNEFWVFRYLQGYMGTLTRLEPKRPTHSNLDTFKDIWGLERRCMMTPIPKPFRYLQGYMGTKYIQAGSDNENYI